ncbi:hypothetical protein [Achromobacter aegrifaciens]|uniref:hypothetical protein n=1 Tax=Achromobacter aegrifaciens TaxID=1287736 RepID=UPI001AD82FCF|nr:hypothetical protein [Achromobacter aegrifaciens]
MPKINLELGKPVEIERSDSTITVQGVGKLVFSQGSAEWWPNGNSVNCKTFTWKKFAAVLEEHGTPKKAPAKKAVAKKAVAKKVAVKNAAAKKAPK